MSVQENINDKIALTISDAWNANDLERVAGVAARNFEAETSGGAKPLTIQEYIAYNQNFLSACPGSTMESRVVVSQGDIVVTHWKVTGIHTATLHLSPKTAIPATGKPVMVAGSSTYLIQNEKIVRLESFWDMASLLSQLGIQPIK